MPQTSQSIASQLLSEEELAVFDLLFRDSLNKAERERLKQASRSLLGSLQALLATMPAWTRNAATQADVKVTILDTLWRTLPQPRFTESEIGTLSDRIYDHVWQQGAQAAGATAGMMSLHVA